MLADVTGFERPEIVRERLAEKRNAERPRKHLGVERQHARFPAQGPAFQSSSSSASSGTAMTTKPASTSTVGTTPSEKGRIMSPPSERAMVMTSPAPKLWIALTVPS